jgi:hypothetical protein
MIIAALVRFLKKIVPNTKMSKAAKTSPVVKKYYYEKATFIKFSDNLITFSYTYDDITAEVEHTLTKEEVKIFKTQIYNVYFNKKTNKLKTGQIFAAIGKTSGEIEYLFWESKDKTKKIRF